MHSRLIVALAGIALSAVCALAREVIPSSLYVVENINSPIRGVGVETQNLLRIQVGGDGWPKVKNLMTLNARFFGPIGGARLVDNRYAVTREGGVIDLKTEQDVTPIGGKKWAAARGLVSPDGTMRLTLEPNDQTRSMDCHFLIEFLVPEESIVDRWFPGAIRTSESKPPVILDGAGLTYEMSAGSSILTTPVSHPVIWLDNRRILTQRRNGELIVVYADGSGQSDLLTIPDEANAKLVSPPYLRRDFEGRVIYWIGHNAYLIDANKRTATPLSRWSLGFGFEISLHADATGLLTVFHEGHEIGRWKSHFFTAAAAPGRIALIYRQPTVKFGEDAGVAIWSLPQKRWHTLPMWPAMLIGWVRSEPSS